jgi:hypothetical protein
MKRTTLKILGVAGLGHLLALSSPLALAQQFAREDLSRKTERPNFVRLDNFIIVVSSRGDKVASLNVQTGKTQLLQLSTSSDIQLNATPVVGPGVVAFYIEGAKITRIAASDTVTGTLIPQDLREPVEGHATPVIGPDVAAYVLGRYAYAFSPTLNRWDVVELAAGHSKLPEVARGHAIVVAPGHIYTFTSKTGKWDHIDMHKLFDSGEGEAK